MTTAQALDAGLQVMEECLAGMDWLEGRTAKPPPVRDCFNELQRYVDQSRVPVVRAAGRALQRAAALLRKGQVGEAAEELRGVALAWRDARGRLDAAASE